MLGSSSPQMRAIFETGVDLGSVEGENLQGSEKSPEYEQETNNNNFLKNFTTFCKILHI